MVKLTKKDLTHLREKGLKEIVKFTDLRTMGGGASNLDKIRFKYIDDEKSIMWVTDRKGYYASTREVYLLVQRLMDSVNMLSNDDLISSLLLNKKIKLNDLFEEPSESKPRVKQVSIGYVYLIKGEFGRYKIGSSKNPKERAVSLKQASSENHTLIAYSKFESPFKIERQLHDKYKDKRKHSEWFELSDTEVAEVIEFLGGKKCNIL